MDIYIHIPIFVCTCIYYTKTPCPASEKRLCFRGAEPVLELAPQAPVLARGPAPCAFFFGGGPSKGPNLGSLPEILDTYPFFNIYIYIFGCCFCCCVFVFRFLLLFFHVLGVFFLPHLFFSLFPPLLRGLRAKRMIFSRWKWTDLFCERRRGKSSMEPTPSAKKSEIQIQVVARPVIPLAALRKLNHVLGKRAKHAPTPFDKTRELPASPKSSKDLKIPFAIPR